jgi:predicted MFS family arabinose efflux permease
MAWAVLRHRDFCLYFAGSLVSNLGNWLQTTAQIVLAYQLTRSALAVGVVACAQYAGSLLLGPWAAVVASRLGGARLLIGIQLLSATFATALAYLQWTRALHDQLLIIGALGLGLASAFALPIQAALIPRLVPEHSTEDAMAMNSVSYNAGRALAPALCVIIINSSGFGWAFALNAMSFVIFAGTLARIRPHPATGATPRVRASDGLSIALQQPQILLLLAIVAAVTFADDPVLVLGPALAGHAFGTSNNWAGYFISALGLGTVLGSLRPASYSRARDPAGTARRTAISLLVLAAAIVVFIGGVSPWVSLLAALAAGVAALRTGAITQAQLVRHRPEHSHSMMALWAIAWAGTKPLASLCDGWIASTLGIWSAGIVAITPAVVLGLSQVYLPPRSKGRINGWTRTRGR